jgi:lysophospholipase L1-like esterase
MTMLAQNPPIYFERNLEHLLVIARHNGVQPVLATFAYVARKKGGDASSSPEIRSAIDEINRSIQRIGAELEVPVFDFAARFPRDPDLFVGGVHLNASGARLKAEIFADYLSESQLIPRP